MAQLLRWPSSLVQGYWCVLDPLWVQLQLHVCKNICHHDDICPVGSKCMGSWPSLPSTFCWGNHFCYHLCPYPFFWGYQILRNLWHACRDSLYPFHICHPWICSIFCPLFHSGYGHGFDLGRPFLCRDLCPPEWVQRAEAFRSSCSFQTILFLFERSLSLSKRSRMFLNKNA